MCQILKAKYKTLPNAMKFFEKTWIKITAADENLAWKVLNESSKNIQKIPKKSVGNKILENSPVFQLELNWSKNFYWMVAVKP